ncbi:MAG: hypothetical protein H7301_00395 [Cryobacterium sp.]|nr:hypothetical protein [Oligoflexia bacterium]
MSKFLALCLLLIPSFSFAADLQLPYAVRHRAYSGYSSTVRGDNENIGMSDATVAIPGSISALETNPAGLTMTMGSVSAQINSNEMEDRQITGTDRKKVRANQWGLAVVPNDWGYSLAYYSPSYEGANYQGLNTSLSRDYEVSLKQLRASVSRSLMNKRLSIGAALQLNRATRTLGGTNYDAQGFAYKFGAIFHLHDHILIGAAYTPPSEVGSSIPDSGGLDLTGFAQPIRTPMLLAVGAGWIPNRFFNLGASIVGVGTTENTALLIDESRTVGKAFTLQPRVGASYTIAQYNFVKVSTALGAYYEKSRTEGIPSRLHSTFAFQVNPYFMNVGVGVDKAERYNNFIFSIGIDIVRTVRTIGIIPDEPVPPYKGFWPDPLKKQADGLPNSLTVGEEKEFSGPSAADVSKIIQNIPQNIENKIKGEPVLPPPMSEPKESKAKARKHRKAKTPYRARQVEQP